MKNTLILLVLFISSCNEKELKDFGVLKVQGMDRFGQNRVCYLNENQKCNQIAVIEEEHFARNCENNGNIVHKCSCHEYVCEIQSFTGVDVNGDTRTCTQMPEDNICTMEFTDSDHFALECEEEGKMPIKCGCHDYICADQQDSGKDSALLDMEYFGTNQDGIQRSCTPMDNSINCNQELNQLQIYAQNCRAQGYEVTWCSCNEVLCLDY